jgi:UDP-2,3-diacylglucosamine pyrophosphatase LpxH
MTTCDIALPDPSSPPADPPRHAPIRLDYPISLDSPSLPLVRDPQFLDAVVISDLHLGSDNCQAKAAAAFLQSLLDGDIKTRRLIINGDVFDSIDFRRLKKTHWKVLSQIRHLSDKLEVIWIAGNHDGSADIISHLLGVTVVEEFILHSGSRKILCIHGHQFDNFITDHPVITALADAAYWLLQKIDRTHYIARFAKRRSKIFVRCSAKIRSGAIRRAHDRRCDTVLCGHTHHAESAAPAGENSVAYHNSGCWTELPPSYLAVQNGVIQTRHYTPVLAASAANGTSR